MSLNVEGSFTIGSMIHVI